MPCADDIPRRSTLGSNGFSSFKKSAISSIVWNADSSFAMMLGGEEEEGGGGSSTAASL